MVKRSRVLEELQAEAEVPYEQTRLARAAAKARPRVALLLALGAAALALEVVAQRSALWLVPALAVALTAWRVRRGGLGSIVASGFTTALALLVPLGVAALRPDDPATWVSLVASFAWGVMLAPGVLTLVRDAELQHAYGLWARRG